MPRRKLAPNRGVPTTPADADEDEGERPSLTDTELNAKSQRNLLAGKKLAEIEPVTSPERPLIAPPSRTMSTRSDDGLVLLSTATRSVPLEHAAAALGDVPGGDGESDEDAYDDLEERRVAELKAFLVLRTAENQRLTAALKQTTVPKLVVYMHDERYFDVHEDEGAALLSFAKHSLGRVVVVKMTLDDNPLAEPIAAMGGFTMDEIREGAGGLRPTGIFLGSEGTMPFDGLYVEEALHWALNDFFEQGAGGSDAKWEPKPKKKKRKKKRAAELR